MLVSVLTPSYNYGRFLGDCLRSVASQTYDEIEHVVMDGGSADETLSVLAAAAGRVTWCSQPDHGQSHALNKALAQSSGEIIGWLNADDAYADTRAVATAVRVFERHPEVGVVYGHSLLVNAQNRVLQLMWAPPPSDWLLRRFTGFTQPAVFLRRSVLPEPFVREDLQFVMDRDLWLRLLGRTRFQRMGVVAAIDRQHGSRKVMTAAYQAERRSYLETGLGQPLPRSLLQALKVGLRLRGALAVPGLKSDLQPAIDLAFDAPLPFLARQLLLPRRLMDINATRPGGVNLATEALANRQEA